MSTIADLKQRLIKVSKINLTAVSLKVGKQVSIDFAKKQYATSGKYGGKPWSGYGGEPKYAAYKLALVGHTRPIEWSVKPGSLHHALTKPSSALRSWTAGKGTQTLTIRAHFLDRLESGGRNFFGERFPGRAIFPNGRALKVATFKSTAKVLYAAVRKAGFPKVGK